MGFENFMILRALLKPRDLDEFLKKPRK